MNYFFAHQEEIDLCWRMQLAGYKVYCLSGFSGVSCRRRHAAKGQFNEDVSEFRNNLIMLAKNLPLGQALWKIPL